jgi:hypothetical protein
MTFITREKKDAYLDTESSVRSYRVTSLLLPWDNREQCNRDATHYTALRRKQFPSLSDNNAGLEVSSPVLLKYNESDYIWEGGVTATRQRELTLRPNTSLLTKILTNYKARVLTTALLYHLVSDYSCQSNLYSSMIYVWYKLSATSLHSNACFIYYSPVRYHLPNLANRATVFHRLSPDQTATSDVTSGTQNGVSISRCVSDHVHYHLGSWTDSRHTDCC